MSDAIEELEGLAKGEARGGKYHRRVTQDGKHRYYYSPEAYTRAHGDAAHISGADALQGKAMRASKKAKKMRKHPVSEAQRRWAFVAEERGELPEGKALEWSRRVKAGTAPMSKSEDTMDAIAGLTRLVKGGEQAGHKYLARKPDGRGGWTYTYSAAKASAEAHAASKRATPASGERWHKLAAQDHEAAAQRILASPKVGEKQKREAAKHAEMAAHHRALRQRVMASAARLHIKHAGHDAPDLPPRYYLAMRAEERAKKSEGTMDAIAGLTRLIKSEGGFHKYISKKMGAGGKWEYEYEAPGGGSVSKHPVEHFHETMRSLHSAAPTKDKTPHPHAVAHALRAVIDHASTLPTQKAKNDLAKEIDHHLSAARTHLTNMRNYHQRDRSGSHYKSPKDEARRITSADVNAAGNVRDLLDQAKSRVKEAGMDPEKKKAAAEKKAAASEQRSKEYRAKQEAGAKGESAARADYLRERLSTVRDLVSSNPGKTREDRDERGKAVQHATETYRAHLNAHKAKHGSLPAGHTMPPEHERTRQSRAESEGQQRFAFSRRMHDAIDGLAGLSKGGEGSARGGKYITRTYQGGRWRYTYPDFGKPDVGASMKHGAKAWEATEKTPTKAGSRATEQEHLDAAHAHREAAHHHSDGGRIKSRFAEQHLRQAKKHEKFALARAGSEKWDPQPSRTVPYEQVMEHVKHSTGGKMSPDAYMKPSASARGIVPFKQAMAHVARSKGGKMTPDEYMKPSASVRGVKKSDAIDGLARLSKGGEKAGHKYISKKATGSGGWTYVYAHPTTGEHVKVNTHAAHVGNEGLTTFAHHSVPGRIGTAGARITGSATEPHLTGASSVVRDVHGSSVTQDPHIHEMLKDAVKDSHKRNLSQEVKRRERMAAKNPTLYGHLVTKKSEGAHAMIESTPSIRKSFRGLDGAQPLAKGLYKFGDYSQNAKMQAIPDEYLLAYLDAFIEEATEHEMREKAHALDAMTMGPTPGGPEHSLAQWVMNELVSYMTCNANLMRAVKMCNCTKDYIADRISAMGLLKPLASHRTDHGDYLQGFMYSEEQEAGYVGKSYGPNTVLDESAMLKAVAHTRAASRAVDGSPVQFAADDPMQALGDFHRAQRARVQAYYGEGSARFDPHAGAPLPKR